MARISLLLTPQLAIRIDDLSLIRGVPAHGVAQTLVNRGAEVVTELDRTSFDRLLIAKPVSDGQAVEIEVSQETKARIDQAFEVFDISGRPDLSEPEALSVVIGHVLDQTDGGRTLDKPWWGGPKAGLGQTDEDRVLEKPWWGGPRAGLDETGGGAPDEPHLDAFEAE